MVTYAVDVALLRSDISFFLLASYATLSCPLCPCRIMKWEMNEVVWSNKHEEDYSEDHLEGDRVSPEVHFSEPDRCGGNAEVLRTEQSIHLIG